MTSPISLVSRRWCGHRRSRGRARYTSVGRTAARQLSQHGARGLVTFKCRGTQARIRVQLGRIAVSNWVLASPSAIQTLQALAPRRASSSGGHRPQPDIVHTNNLPAHKLQAFDFQVLDSRIVRNQGRANSFGVGRNHDVKCSRTPPETPGTDPNSSGMGFGCDFIPWVN